MPDCIRGQSSIANSTIESEYIETFEAVVVWLRNFLINLGLVPFTQSAITVHCNNIGAIVNLKEPRSHKRGKHIERNYHIIRETVGRGDGVVSHIASEDNLAYPLTKDLS